MSEKKYIVLVTDHAHYMEEEGKYTRGEFATQEEAESKCKEIMENSLQEIYKPEMSEDEIRKQFLLFGEEASCEGFDSQAYLEKRYKELSANFLM